MQALRAHGQLARARPFARACIALNPVGPLWRDVLAVLDTAGSPPEPAADAGLAPVIKARIERQGASLSHWPQPIEGFGLSNRGVVFNRPAIFATRANGVTLLKIAGHTAVWSEKGVFSRFGYGLQAGLIEAASLVPEGISVDGPTILLTAPFGRDNYAHVLLDQVARLFSSASLAAGIICEILIDEGAPRFCDELVGLIAPGARLLRLADARQHRLASVELLSPLHHPINNGQPELLAGFRALAQRVRQERSIRAMPRRFFIERPAGRRGARNTVALAAMLDRFGIASVQLEALSCAEQIELFAGAELVVAAHGAGLANIVFAPPGARVVEVFQRAYGTPAYRKLAAALELNYTPLVDPAHDSRPSRAEAKFEDLTFPLDLLGKVLSTRQPR